MTSMLPRSMDCSVRHIKSTGRDASAWIIQHVQIPADIGRQLSRIDTPVLDLRICISEMTGVASSGGGVQCTIAVGMKGRQGILLILDHPRSVGVFTLLIYL